MAFKLNTSHYPLHSTQLTPKHRANFITQFICSSSSTSPSKSTIEPLTVEFKTLGDCKLGISRYPDFKYNAEGGRGKGTVEAKENANMAVSFDLESLYIPPLTNSTTKFLGLPLPPFLRIDIVPELLRGTINRQFGKVELEFKAKFLFAAGNIYKAQPLMVATILTSDESTGKLRSGKGERMNKEGMCKLVGVATVDPIDDFLMNTFLSLPTECLASLNASVCFIN